MLMLRVCVQVHLIINTSAFVMHMEKNKFELVLLLIFASKFLKTK